MPTRRQVLPLNLEEASTIDYEDCWLLGSDDELDETTRAVKRRRIETLGESYLQGKPLFIASASLRGPFDKGWVNPWRKHRREQHDTGIARAATVGLVDDATEFAVPDTSDSRSYKGGPPSKAKSIRSDVREYSSSPRITRRESRHSNSFWKGESSTSHTGRGPSADFQPAQAWLKRDKKVIDIQNYDPPRSPSSRYAGSGGDGLIKLPKNTSKKSEAGFARATKSHQTDLRNVRRNKPVSGDIQEKHVQTFPDSTSSTFLENEKYQKAGSNTEQEETSILSSNAEIGKSSDEPHTDKDGLSRRDGPAHQEADIPTSASSIHIVPPSSRLPEFKYRVARGRSREGTESQHAPSRTEAILPSVDTSHAKDSSSFKAPLPKSQPDQTSILAQSTATLTCSERPNDSLPESEKLPSAQIVPKPPGASNCFISLHTAEYRASDAAETGTTSLDGELSTQAAFELAQKSFQDDLATPQRSSQSPPKTRKSIKSAVRRITPFANVNNSRSTSDIRIGFKSTPGTNHNMNTQAMIDAFTPFSDIITGGAGKETGLRPGVYLDASKAQIPKEPDFEASRNTQAQSTSPPYSPPSQADQDPEQYSIPPLPLTLSGTTPATNQQDGQGYFFSQDAFDVSQVIKDAGSWLQRSFDINEDLKEVTKQSSPNSRPEVAL